MRVLHREQLLMTKAAYMSINYIHNPPNSHSVCLNTQQRAATHTREHPDHLLLPVLYTAFHTEVKPWPHRKKLNHFQAQNNYTWSLSFMDIAYGISNVHVLFTFCFVYKGMVFFGLFYSIKRPSYVCRYLKHAKITNVFLQKTCYRHLFYCKMPVFGLNDSAHCKFTQ